jgi:SOS-response transcriptional repressor LexA
MAVALDNDKHIASQSDLTRIENQVTPRQREVLDFIRSHYREQGIPPSLREICAAMNIASPNGVMTHVRVLRKHGLLRHLDAKVSHSLIPTVPDGCCPCCGRRSAP